MPHYEYECNRHGERPLRFEERRPMSESSLPAPCPQCGEDSQRVMSVTHWYMGWNYLKGKALDSAPAPEDPGYYPEWDQAYQGPQVTPRASIPK